MATKQNEIPRGQQLYFRYISLYGKAVSLTIKAFIKTIINKRKQPLKTILTDRKEHIKTFYSDLYKVLFEDNNGNFDEQIESWELLTLCGVFFVLTDNSQIDCIKCILDQKLDLENYAEKNHMDYDTFKYKWNGLTSSLLRLCKDTDVNITCKRLIHSFEESNDIQIRKEVYKKLQQTRDVNRQIQIVSDVHTDCNSGSYMLSDVDKDKQTVQFELQLSDIVVNVGESVILSCKLNKDELRVIWSKNGDILTNTKSVQILANQRTHVLLIPKSTTEDSGKYSCEYQDLSTSASIIVSKQELYFGKPLHIEDDGDIGENMKLSLSCTINIPGKIPSWFHNDQEIDGSNENVTITSTDCEHKLIIQHFELADEGEYIIAFDRLTSKTSVKLQGTTSPKDLIIQKHMKEELFKNWMRGVLGLKYLKLGLELPAEKAVTTHHEQIVKDIPLSVIKCTECNGDNLLPLHSKRQCPIKQTKQSFKCMCSRDSRNRRICPNDKLCSRIYEMIVRDHRFESPALKNSSMDKWRNDAWSIAACYNSHGDFIHPSEYRLKVSAKELDCAELLTLFVNNKAYLPDTKYGVFEMARMHRNKLLHNASYEISKTDLSDYLTDFQDVLKVTDNSNQRIFPQAVVEQALKALIELQNNEIDINTKEKIEQMKMDIRRSAMNEAAKQLESALRQKDEEFRNLKEKIESISKTGEREGMFEKQEITGSSLYCRGHNTLFCQPCEERKYRAPDNMLVFKEIDKSHKRYSRQREIADGKLHSDDVRTMENKLVAVAIEIGNTCSWCAFSSIQDYEMDPLRMYAKEWNNRTGSMICDKNRSVVLFDENKKFHSFGFEADDAYVKLAENGEHHMWFYFKNFTMKLRGMDKTRDFEIDDDKGRKMKAIDVFGAVIKYLKDNLLDLLKTGVVDVQNKDIHWILTVPAIWTDSAKQLMREAAYSADVEETQLTIVTEPEAAIVYYQMEKKIKKLTTADISSPGTKCMVIDIGDNTVDFTLLERLSDGGHREIKAATGIACGIKMVKEEFCVFIRSITGEAVYHKWIDEYVDDHIDLQNNFEIAIRTIKGNENPTFKCPPSIRELFREINHEDISQATERSQYKDRIKFIMDILRIDVQLVKQMCKPCTDMIVNHVQHLLEELDVQGTSIFLMVGRFSEAPIVQEAIIKAFPTVNVIIPQDPGMVVLKGAVIYGQQH